jgi:signal transduction histidine kinase
MTTYAGPFSDTTIFYDATAPDGTRNLVLYYPIVGRGWAIVLTVSAQQAQQMALDIVAPLLVVLAFSSVGVFILMQLGVQVVTRSLHGLAAEAHRISAGDLAHPLEIGGVDEVGQLAGAFDEMRIRLKARLEELEQLFLVAQGVAASLEADTAVKPVLESALTTGAVAAYVALSEIAMPDLGERPAPLLAAGPAAEKYAHLSSQLHSLTSQQDQIALTNPARARMLKIEPGHPVPEAIFAAALSHENINHGCLWVAYDKPHPFSEDERNFLSTLAVQASLGVGNARSYLEAEIGRQRLEAILHATPDPVLVTDHKNQIYLANAAAISFMIDSSMPIEGLPIEKVLEQPELIAVIKSADHDLQTVEIALPDGRYYYATASSILAEGKWVGRVCILQEITRFKELDALKSEFVNSVSHDLRSPLALMQGYATMLQMVGDLNEQQTSYVRKIIQGVENMARLVSNLLDLGRIETGVGLKLEKVPIVELVERVAGAQQLHAAQKRIELGADIPAHVTSLIDADKALLEQALQNLVDNAIKYTKIGGVVRIRLFERNQRIIFEVRDNGIGIAPLDIPRLFERFYRGARRETRQQRGTGLGLAIVKSIADRHGGRVWVESRLGVGSQFFLEIPISQPQADVQISDPEEA